MYVVASCGSDSCHSMLLPVEKAMRFLGVATRGGGVRRPLHTPMQVKQCGATPALDCRAADKIASDSVRPSAACIPLR